MGVTYVYSVDFYGYGNDSTVQPDEPKPDEPKPDEPKPDEPKPDEPQNPSVSPQGNKLNYVSAADMKNEYWVASEMIFTDIKGGGVNIDFKGDNGGMITEGYRALLDKRVSLDGLYLEFDHFKPDGGGPSGMGIAFSHSLWIRIDSNNRGGLSKQVSWVLGEKGTQTGTLYTDVDKLGIEGISNYKFSFYFSFDEEGNLQVDFTIDGDKYTGAKIPADVIDASKINTSSTELRIGSGNTRAMDCTFVYSVDFYGYCNDQIYRGNVPKTIEQIDKIGTVELSDASAMRKARSMYEILTDDDKALVTNYSKLTAAEKRFDELAAQADFKLDYHDKNNYHLYDKDLYYGVWSPAFRLEELETGGTKYIFDNAIRGMRQGVKLTTGLDGMFFQFDNLNAAKPAFCSLTMMITQAVNSWGPEWNGADSHPLALVLDTEKGQIVAKFGRSNDSIVDKVIIEDEMLKLENIALQRFSYLFNKTGDKEFTLTVNVGGKELKGVITEEIINDSSFRKYVDEECSLMVTNWNNASYSFDFIGFYDTKNDATINALISKINALPKVITESDIEAVMNAAAQYNDMTFKYRRFVSNYSKLADAINQVNALKADDISENEDMPTDTDGNPQYGGSDISEKTGETSHIWLWASLAIISAGALFAQYMILKKRKNTSAAAAQEEQI